MVELAAALPTVMLLVLGCVDFGRVFYYQSAVTNAARAGAQAGATTRRIDRAADYWNDLVEAAVLQEMERLPRFDAADVAVNVAASEDADGLQVTTVEVEYVFRTFVDWPGVDAQVNLKHQVVMRQMR